MRYRPIQAASRERVPITLWSRSRFRSVLAAVAASAVALVPAVMIASPAQAVNASSISNLTITDAGAWEGGNVTFTLTYTGTGPGDFTIATAASSPLSAVGAPALVDPTVGTEDYDTDPSRTTFTFPGGGGAGNTTTVTVATQADIDTADETFRLAVTDTNSDIKYATGTIWAASAYPTFTLTAPSAAVAETASGPDAQKTVTVNAALSDVLPHPVTIPVSTVDGTAVSTGEAFRDFTALPANAAITIPAYSYTGTVDVSLWDDSVREAATQTFTVASGTVAGATNSGGAATITIADDEPVPTVNIADASAATENDWLNFPVTLSGPSELPVTVTASTADGTVRQDSNAATSAGLDYTAQASASVVISPYTRTRNFSVKSLSDASFEGPENVRAVLSGTPTNATLGTPTTAYGVINDATAGPTATLDTTGKTGNSIPSGSSFVEGATGEVVRNIGVTLGGGAPWNVPVKIDYAFRDGTATNGVDYRGTAGSITIPAGTTPSNVEIPVTIIGDTVKEGTGGPPDFETFDVVLSSTTGTIDSGSTGATIHITEDTDDVTPTWSVGNATVTEGDTGTPTAKVPVVLSAPAAADTVFSIALSDGTATETGVSTGTTVGANDYDYPTNRSVTIPAGKTTVYVEIPVNADTVYERDETFVVTPTQTTSGDVSNTPAAGTLQAAAVTITNDDVKPSITFNNLTGNEGSLLRVNGTISGLSQYEYNVGFAIAGGQPDPATSGTDFDAPTNIANWSVTVPRGTTGALADLTGNFPFDVYLTPDTIDEATESFTLTATETTPSPMGFTTSVGTYKITDDPSDVPPAASIRDESIGEDEGSVDVHVDLTQVGDTTATQQTITIPYWTVDGSAKAGQDYAETKGTLSVAPGVTSTFIKVPVINDKVGEGNENFWVKLGTPTSPTGATIAKGAGEVIIKLNDGGSGGENPNEPGEPNEPEQPGAPTISAPAKVVGAVAVPISGQAASGATVELWGAPMGGGDLKYITSTTANAEGRYSFSRWIGVGHRFATQANDLNSEEITVTVQQKPVLAASSPSGGKLALTVTGNPRAAGQTVIVQRWIGGKWVNTWRGTTGSNNQWRATVNATRGASYTLRAFVAGYTPDGLAPGYTVAKNVGIRR